MLNGLFLMLINVFRVHAIAARISPLASSSGLEVLETETFRLQCFQTTSGQYIHDTVETACQYSLNLCREC